MSRRPLSFVALPLLSFVALLLLSFALAPRASAQDRSRTDRARMELVLDVGVGPSSEGVYGEVAADWRLWAPFGLGGVLRLGVATTGLSNAFASDLGLAYRFALHEEEHLGVQLAAALGPSLAYGPFDAGNITAYGGFAMIHLDFWYRNVVVGVGVSGHVMVGERHAQPDGRDDVIVTLAPTVRFGGEWGL